MSRDKDRSYRLTVELLQSYCDAAIENAAELIQEAGLLEKHGHSARAYFLAVSSLEETGKAVMAFEAKGRNLANPEVTHRLKLSFDDHQQKVVSAFVPWLKTAPDLRKSVEYSMALAADISLGREPSMYTNILTEGPVVQTPASVVRPIAAADCVRLANDTLNQAKIHVNQPSVQTFSRADDELFALKPDRFRKLLNNPDFWEYYIAQIESGNQDFAKTVIDYYKDYFMQSRLFKQVTSDT